MWMNVLQYERVAEDGTKNEGEYIYKMGCMLLFACIYY